MVIKPTQTIDQILAQRAELKRRDPEAILLFRVEDGYVAFGDDARELLTNLPELIEYHTSPREPDRDRAEFGAARLEAVLSLIVAAGRRAAVCEQVQGPAPAAAKVERVVTEGKFSHRITLTYTNDDDGIWLECSCGWRKCLDHGPDISLAAFEAAHHRNHPEERA
jgi:DNA mismatch repair ATPase MutS